jgi:acyl carrier protein
MTMIFDRLRKILAEQFGVEEDSIVASSSLAYDLNADSSDIAELVATIEDEFSGPNRKFEIADEDTDKFYTVQDIIDYLRDFTTEE